MKKEEMQMRNTRRQKSGKNNKKKVIITSLVGLALVAGAAMFIFKVTFTNHKSKWSFCRLVKCKCCRRKISAS